MRALLLALLLILALPSVSHAYELEVRLTYYALDGITFSGAWTHWGGAACSWNLPLGTHFWLGGEEFICNDRGLLGSRGWVDLWMRKDLADRFGPYTTVDVVEDN